MSDNSEVSRLEQSNVLGLSFFRTIITLNGGGILALLTYLGNAESQTNVSIGVQAIKYSMLLFLVGIMGMMLALLFSYSYTAAIPGSRWSSFWNSRIILFNSVLGLVSLSAFASAVITLLRGAVAL